MISPPICVGSLALPAVHSDRSVLAELLLGFVHLSDEIDEALSGFWHPLLWPVGELELADCSGLAILGGARRGRRFRRTEEFTGCFEGGRTGRYLSKRQIYCDADEEVSRRLGGG